MTINGIMWEMVNYIKYQLEVFPDLLNFIIFLENRYLGTATQLRYTVIRTETIWLKIQMNEW